MNNYQAILLMAGSGQRFNDSQNKTLIKVANDYLFNHSLKVFLNDTKCEEIYLVVNNNDLEEVKQIVKNEKIRFIIGGSTRLESVKNALKYVTKQVLIHDAARSILNQEDIDLMLKELETYDAVTYYEKCIDTYRINEDGKIKNIDRNKMYKIVTPQGYKQTTFNKILSSIDSPQFTDEISILLNYDYNISHLEALHSMPKLTYKQDLDYINFLLEKDKQYLIGHSFDFHPFVDGEGINLGGVFIPFTKRLKGWSDGDALIHAVAESIIGALALGDIGKLYPDNDPKYKGICSKYFLEDVRKILIEKSYEIVNIDTIVYLEKPNLKNYKLEMAKQMAELLGINNYQVNVKATTTEQKGLVGKGEGIGAEAIVLLKKK